MISMPNILNAAFLLVVGKLLEPFCPGHSLQSAHRKRSRSKRSELCKGVDENLERLISSF